MQFITFLSIALTLGSLPWLGFSVYSSLERWERQQIALDNASIRFGRQAREVFKNLDSQNQKIEQLEMVHHPIHVCRPLPSCLKGDVAIEMELQSLHRQIWVMAQTGWRNALSLGQAELERLGVVGRLEGYPSVIPLRVKVCRVCGLPLGWVPSNSRMNFEWKGLAPPTLRTKFQVKTSSSVSSSQINYKILGEFLPDGWGGSHAQ